MVCDYMHPERKTQMQYAMCQYELIFKCIRMDGCG